MRDPKRIHLFIEKFEACWKMYPDLRFWQIIGMIAESNTEQRMIDPFFWEETDWLQGMDSILSRRRDST